MIFALSAAGTGLLILFCGWFIYAAAKKESILAVPVTLICLVILLLCFVGWKELTDDIYFHPVEQSKCEWTRTSTTLYVECGGRKAQTNDRYIYENIGDSTKVEIAVEEERDVFSTDYKRLTVRKK